MENKLENGVLTLFISGRIDSATAENAEKEMFEIIHNNNAANIIIDCSDLNYIASAGLRVLLKIGKEADSLSIINASREVYEVLDLTGFTGMFDTKRKMREISVDGCKIIGGGLSSNVYRIDRETVVKLYAPRVTLERIYKETASAKKSFVAGIPTAIPYDVVKCGESYGTIFELIDADTLSQTFMDYPERFDGLMEKYVKLLKQFHSTPAIMGTFPDIREKYHEWAAGLKKYLTDEELDKIDRMIDAVPFRQTMIHVDCHSRNIMVQDDKLIFVDMADVSIGHPLFDIGAEYFHYMILRTTCLGAKIIFGVEPEDSELPVRVWNDLVRRYFAQCREDQMDDVRKMLKYFGGLRCLIMVAKHAHIDYDSAMDLITPRREDLFPFAEEAIDLFSRADEFFI